MIKRYTEVYIDCTDGQWIDFEVSDTGYWVKHKDLVATVQKEISDSCFGGFDEDYERGRRNTLEWVLHDLLGVKE